MWSSDHCLSYASPIHRRSFLAGLVATAAGLLVPARLLEDDPKRVYSFIRRPVEPTIRIYKGMMPSSADAAILEELLLAELEFSNSTFVDHSANGTGTASWVRFTDRVGRSIDVPVAGPGIHDGFALNTRAIVAGATVTTSGLFARIE